MKFPVISLGQMLSTLTEFDHVRGDGPVNVWRGATLGMPTGFVFGSQLVGQAIGVASRLDPTQPVRSIHLTFVKPVPDTGSVEFTVTTLHGGKQYATQRVEVIQPGRDGRPEVAVTATVVSHRDAPGIEHGAEFPADAGAPGDGSPVATISLPGEQRVVGTTDLDDATVQPNRYLVWARMPEALPDAPAAHQALLSFASELPLIGTSLLQHTGWSQADAHVGLRTAVLTHQMVFHRPFRYDDWLLLSHTSPAASGGSSYGRSDIFDAAGAHVASVSQEAMVRVAKP